MSKKTIKPIYVSFVLFFILPFFAQAASTKEKDIKAAFLFNFTQFITWPKTAFKSADVEFTMCILGKNPFGKTLHKLLKNEVVGEHPIVLKIFDELEQTGECHVLYIDDSVKYDLDDIFAFVRGKAILTISDIKKFVQKGGMIEFFKQKRKIRFYISPDSMRDVDLVPNSNLLRVAKIVKR
jgi:hypothetical protein